jgi:hypothetical protein
MSLWTDADEIFLNFEQKHQDNLIKEEKRTKLQLKVSDLEAF